MASTTTETSPLPEVPGPSAFGLAAVEPMMPTARQRYWPAGRGARTVFVAAVVAMLACLGYLIAIRYGQMFFEFSADGDQPQAVWHYWRYRVSGAFPPGQLMTDYAFAMHAPPGWWLMMASLSTFTSPLVAAKVLNLVAYVGTHVVIWAAVSRRSNAFVGLAAAFLLMRNVDFSAIIAGGYARSFGPMLTLAFLGAFMVNAHRLVLVILVVQAALYPSVVIPCGICYGLYTVVAGPMPQRLRRMAGMFVAGLLIIAFGKFQDLRAPPWWGGLVTLEEALEMPAWQAGGRVSEAPLRPASMEMSRNVQRAFRTVGQVPLPGAGGFIARHAYLPVLGPIVLGIATLPLLAWWRRRRAARAGQPAASARLVDPFPWQVVLLFCGAFIAYWLARFLAFKLYLPYRPLQHVWAYCFYAGIPLLTWSLARNLIKNTSVATVVAVSLAVVPVVLFFGNGNEAGPANYGRYDSNAKLYRWIQKQPVGKMFAGEFGFVDKTPLFTWHQSYVTKNLAHPFRKGYYGECERRIRLMYEALYATDLQAAVAFAQAEGVDYFIVRRSTFTELDTRLFQPVKRDLAATFKNAKKKGFALASPPQRAIVFRDRDTRVLSVARLAEYVATLPPAAAAAGAVDGADASTGDGATKDGATDAANDGDDREDREADL